MTNTTLLQDKIKRSGLKIGFLAKTVGLSRQQFSKKVNNMAPFNQLEIDALCNVLHITSLRDKEAIFFAK
jgi:hypothetical protein